MERSNEALIDLSALLEMTEVEILKVTVAETLEMMMVENLKMTIERNIVFAIHNSPSKFSLDLAQLFG